MLQFCDASVLPFCESAAAWGEGRERGQGARAGSEGRELRSSQEGEADEAFGRGCYGWCWWGGSCWGG
eukprot:429932-Alexandrium_andersonii.AAC.1